MFKLNLDLLPINFDWQYYIDIHPDLQVAGIKTQQQAAAHYLLHGQKEYRNYCPTTTKNNDIVFND